MTEAELKAIEERASKATEGPWYHIPHPDYPGSSHRITTEPDGSWYDFSQLGNLMSNNAAFVCAAREDIPTLVAEVRRLMRENDSLEDQLGNFQDNEDYNLRLVARLDNENKQLKSENEQLRINCQN